MALSVQGSAKVQACTLESAEIDSKAMAGKPANNFIE
jgi:hypothetical protein